MLRNRTPSSFRVAVVGDGMADKPVESRNPSGHPFDCYKSCSCGPARSPLILEPSTRGGSPGHGHRSCAGRERRVSPMASDTAAVMHPR